MTSIYNIITIFVWYILICKVYMILEVKVHYKKVLHSVGSKVILIAQYMYIIIIC
jgi:hypothetical protein